ncbi:zf-HC2 domain-containing protein [Romeria aff. gracilis LEGE 07310]|uniref:Zf-HC2 domain-containing protein n=1 Tax=Vasconcelosia minhoensis LEGE 07310 TaxID=915328 RepID=A0A8J7ADN3_9CYAN|nr:zf-HC2 domain-containing protein [Romeria gracilis]MBE9077594.1 zf-HC2 domain-containing protein [Romeria aff. gracilis LEGE 07310]
MTSNSDRSVPVNPSPSSPFPQQDQSAPAKAISQDQFELLSAYLDGEVSVEESQRVSEWLSSDVAAQQLYQQQLMLRRGLRALTVAQPAAPPAAQPVAKKYTNAPATVTLNQLDPRLSPIAVALLCAVSTVVIGILTSIISPPLELGDWLQLGTPSVNQETQSPDLE